MLHTLPASIPPISLTPPLINIGRHTPLEGVILAMPPNVPAPSPSPSPTPTPPPGEGGENPNPGL